MLPTVVPCPGKISRLVRRFRDIEYLYVIWGFKISHISDNTDLVHKRALLKHLKKYLFRVYYAQLTTRRLLLIILSFLLYPF